MVILELLIYLLISSCNGRHNDRHNAYAYNKNNVLANDYYSNSDGNNYYQGLVNLYDDAINALLDEYDLINDYFYSLTDNADDDDQVYSYYDDDDADYYDDDNADYDDEVYLFHDNDEEENGVSFGSDLIVANAADSTLDNLAHVIIFATTAYSKTNPGLHVPLASAALNNATNTAIWKAKLEVIKVSCNKARHIHGSKKARKYRERTGLSWMETVGAKMYAKASGISYLASKYYRTIDEINNACGLSNDPLITAIPSEIAGYIKLLKAGCFKAKRYSMLKDWYKKQKKWAEEKIKEIDEEKAKPQKQRSFPVYIYMNDAAIVVKKTEYQRMTLNNYLILYTGFKGLTFSDNELTANRVSNDNGNVWWGPTSSSLDYRVALKFAGSSPGATIFQIKVPMEGNTLRQTHPGFGALDIISVSPYAEAEILLWNVPRAFVNIYAHKKTSGNYPWWRNGDYTFANDNDYFVHYQYRNENWEEWGAEYNCNFEP